MEPPTVRYRAPLSIVAALSTASALALAVQSPAQPAPAAVVAAAFNQPYSTTASGEVLHLNALSVAGLPGVADAGIGISTGTTSGSPTHAATAEARNLDVKLLGGQLPAILAHVKQTAPPDNPVKATQTSIPGNLLPLLNLGVSTANASARTPTGTDDCFPGTTLLSSSDVTTADVSLLDAPGIGALLALPGTLKTAQATALVPNTIQGGPGARDVVAAVTGTAADIELLDGEIQVSVAESPVLRATATGRAGSASVSWNAPLVKVTFGGTEYTLPVNGSPLDIVLPSNPLISLELKLGRLENLVESADGTRASGDAAVLNVAVGLLGITIADLDLFPFAVDARAPLGGVKCGTATGPDGDGDGLTDPEEAIVGTNPANPDTDGDGTNDGAEDNDGDGVTNLQEFRGSENDLYNNEPTNPVDADSDNDGLSDGAEIFQTGTDPNRADTDSDGINDANEDPDADGLTNLEEVTGSENDAFANAPTDPTDPDSDNGGVKDGTETDRLPPTNPNNPADDNPGAPSGDSDGDGLTDVQENNQTHTNPTNPDSDGDGVNDGAEDPDGDGLSNLEEVNGTENDLFNHEPTNPLNADTDGDGLSDSEEIYETGTNPNVRDTDGDGTEDGLEDPDGDGLTNEQETSGSENDAHGNESTDPRDADSDNGGVNDGDEVADGTNPNDPSDDVLDPNADPDGDGLTNAEENQIGTDPTDPDTDGDGVNDGAEDPDRDGLTNLQEFRGSANAKYGHRPTNPLDADTDNDGLKDGAETTRGTNPRDADTDNDRLKDGREVLQLRTNPLKKDTDNDGLSDWQEVTGAANKRYNKCPTNPKRKDSDHDLLTDGLEVKRYKTNPCDKDTDHGGVRDGVEVAAGSDPLDPTSTPSHPRRGAERATG
jgi:hypothetical protein